MLLWLAWLQLLHTSVCLVVASCSVYHGCNCCTRVCVSLLHVALSVMVATVSYVSVSRCCILRCLSRLQLLDTSVCLVVACYCLCLSRLQLLHTCVSVIVACYCVCHSCSHDSHSSMQQRETHTCASLAAVTDTVACNNDTHTGVCNSSSRERHSSM